MGKNTALAIIDKEISWRQGKIATLRKEVENLIGSRKIIEKERGPKKEKSSIKSRVKSGTKKSSGGLKEDVYSFLKSKGILSAKEIQEGLGIKYLPNVHRTLRQLNRDGRIEQREGHKFEAI